MGTIKIRPNLRTRLTIFFISSLILSYIGYCYDPTVGIQIAFVSVLATAVAGAFTTQAVPTFAAAIWAGEGVAFAYAATYVAGSLALSAASQALSKELADDKQGTQDFADRTRTTRQSIEPRRVVYGRSKVGGTITFIDETDNSEFLHLIVSIADHEIESFDEIYLDKDKLSLTQDITTDTDISSVNQVNDNIVINGKLTDTLSDGDSITVVDNIKDVDNNGDYTVDGSATYDSNSNETTINVNENVEYDIDKGTVTYSGNSYAITDVDNVNNKFMVGGDLSTLSGGETITIEDNNFVDASIDGDYTVDGSPSYDSNNAETTIDVKEDVKYESGGGFSSPNNDKGDVEYTLENVVDSTDNYGDKVVVRKHLGADDQTADEMLINESSNWTDSHRGRGVAYLYVRLEWDRDTFSGGIPNVSAVIDGKNDIYDPRDDSHKFTDNPALCIRDYIVDNRRGLDADASEIDTDVVKKSANICDQSVNLADGGSQDRYDLDGTIKLDQRPMDVIRDMNGAMDGVTTYTTGQYHIQAGADSSSVLQLDAGDIKDNFSVNTKQSRRNTFNRIKGTYVSPENDWQATDFPPITDSTALSNDNGEKRWQDIQLPFTTNPAMAQRIAKYRLSDNRQQKTISATFGLRAMELVPGDVFELSFERYGWDTKEFKVKEWALVLTETGEDGEVELSVQVTAKEWDSSVYAWDENSDEQAVSDVPETNLPDPSDVSAPTNLQLNSGDDTLFIEPDGTVVPRIETTWNQPTDQFVTSGGDIEIQFKKSSESTWEKEGFVDGGDTQDFIGSVHSGIDYDVRVRSVSSFGFTSDWTTTTNHTVIGKTALPSDVTGLNATQNGEAVNLSWNHVSDDDLGGYIIKYGEKDNSDWENSRTLTEVNAGTAITSQLVPPGDYTFCIKAIDTSGNLSESANCTDLEVINDFDVLHQREYAPAWNDFAGDAGIIDSGAWGLESWGSFTWGASGPSFYKHWTGKLVPADAKNADQYSGFELFDTYVPSPVSVSGYQGEEHDVGTEVEARIYADISGGFGPDEAGNFNPVLEVDYRSEGENYDGFERWTVGVVKARYFRFRLKLVNEIGEVEYVDGFEEAVDADERSESAEGVTIDSNGTTITFDTPFVNDPFITVSTTSGSAKIATKDSVDAVDFVAHVFDTDGTEVGGTIDWRAEGV